MTLTELTNIIVDTLEETEEDVLQYAETAQKIVSITIMVMDALKGVVLDVGTRDLIHALTVQKIVRTVSNRSSFPGQEFPHQPGQRITEPAPPGD